MFTDDVERTIAGSRIKRKASRQEPAYLIEQEDGASVLKSRSELERVD
ncbi:HVA1 family protein [Agrobacterium tumefaciens]